MEKKTIELSLAEAKILYSNGGISKTIALSAFTEEELEKETYKDICYKFFNDTYYTIDVNNKCQIVKGNLKDNAENPINAPFPHQLEKLLAVNQLVNVANYLNDGWVPDWKNNEEYKYFLTYNHYYADFNDCIVVDYNVTVETSAVYFATPELATLAINILGEDTIKLAIASHWFE